MMTHSSPDSANEPASRKFAFLLSLRDIMKSAHAKEEGRLMSVWVRDIQAIEWAISVLESSSAVEQGAVNARVAGSIPASPAIPDVAQAAIGPGNPVYEETRAAVTRAREKGYAAALANLKEAWSALAMIRETVETLAPSGSVKASEHLDGPTFMHEAEALVAGIMALAAPPQPAPATIFEECAEIALEHVGANAETGYVFSIAYDEACRDIADAIKLRSSNRKVMDALVPAAPQTVSLDREAIARVIKQTAFGGAAWSEPSSVCYRVADAIVALSRPDRGGVE